MTVRAGERDRVRSPIRAALVLGVPAALYAVARRVLIVFPVVRVCES